MKNILTAAAIAMATFTTPAAAMEMTVSDCYYLGDSLSMLATARDQGILPGTLYGFLLEEGLDEELTIIMLELVFLTGYMYAPDELGRLYTLSCIGESA